MENGPGYSHHPRAQNPPGAQQKLQWVERDELLLLLSFPQEPNNSEGQTPSIPNIYQRNCVFWQETVAFGGKNQLVLSQQTWTTLEAMLGAWDTRTPVL